MAKDVTDGIDLLKERLAGLPTTPGVYRMLNAKGDVLYVGKARNLKARLTSYTQPERMVVRIRKMVFETRDLVVVETRTEAEALLLEANLIKSLKPRYNIIFRDDSSYVSVLITDEATPLIKSHRGARRVKGDYFGPYPSASAVYQTLDLMERAFRLRTCVETVFRNRTRPCLKYDIKRCSGPCVGKIDPAAYKATVAQARRFLRGERSAVLKDMQAAMAAASSNMEFEQAGAIRDRIKALSAVAGGGSALSHALPEADVFAIVREGGRLGIQAFYYRNGQHVGNQMYYPRNLGTEEPRSPGAEETQSQGEEEEELAEALRVFLALHYTQRAAVGLLLCNIKPADIEALGEALSVSAGRKVRIEAPSRGDKYDVIAQAASNARKALHRKNAENDGWAAQMQAFGTMLELPRGLELLECYDISNISGRFPVASCVVAGREGMLRQRYRRYHIKTKNTPDDYAMLREVLTRRVEKGMKELTFDDEGRPLGLPDVLLVDGGKGQLNVLVDVVRGLGLLGQPECPALVGIAKGEERDKGLETIFRAVVSPTGEVELQELPVTFNSALIFVLQRIRDEAHRFAITFHRESRGKALAVSRLDGIPGVGPTKKKALLLHFGSVEGVRGASVEDLAQVAGIGEELAQVIYDYFRAS